MTPPLGTLEYLYIGTANFERDCANSRTPAGTPTPYFREDTIDSFPGGRLLSRRPVRQSSSRVWRLRDGSGIPERGAVAGDVDQLGGAQDGKHHGESGGNNSGCAAL